MIPFYRSHLRFMAGHFQSATIAVAWYLNRATMMRDDGSGTQRIDERLSVVGKRNNGVMERSNDNEIGRRERQTRLRWEGKGIITKMLGTVGTWLLARFLGEYTCFSRVPKSAIGTLAKTGKSPHPGPGLRENV